jgi:hypothetical protein
VLAHGKMDTAKIIPEHASQAFTWEKHKYVYRKGLPRYPLYNNQAHLVLS